jgi:broad specificity phosphatase PhoE
MDSRIVSPRETEALAADQAFFSVLKGETHFFIVRHGQSEGNAKRVFQGRIDMPLDETGRAQARAVGTWLAKQGVSGVLSSPLARAAETGRIIAAACGGIEVELDDDLMELDTGIFSGLGFEEARARHPDIFSSFEGRSWDAVPGAEKAAVLYDRALRAWRRLRDRASVGDGAIVCVSHGGFIQWLVRSTFGSTSWMPLVSTANCGVFELFVSPTEVGSAHVQWRLMNFVASEAMKGESLPIF